MHVMHQHMHVYLNSKSLNDSNNSSVADLIYLSRLKTSTFRQNDIMWNSFRYSVKFSPTRNLHAAAGGAYVF